MIHLHIHTQTCACFYLFSGCMRSISLKPNNWVLSKEYHILTPLWQHPSLWDDKYLGLKSFAHPKLAPLIHHVPDAWNLEIFWWDVQLLSSSPECTWASYLGLFFERQIPIYFLSPPPARRGTKLYLLVKEVVHG